MLLQISLPVYTEEKSEVEPMIKLIFLSTLYLLSSFFRKFSIYFCNGLDSGFLNIFISKEPRTDSGYKLLNAVFLESTDDIMCILKTNKNDRGKIETNFSSSHFVARTHSHSINGIKILHTKIGKQFQERIFHLYLFALFMH
jgi:hypothetical protein